MKSSNHIAALAHLSILTETLTLMGASNVEVKFFLTSKFKRDCAVLGEEVSLERVLSDRGAHPLDCVRIQVRMAHSGERLGVSYEVARACLWAIDANRYALPTVFRELEYAFLAAIRAKAESTATVKATSLI